MKKALFLDRDGIINELVFYNGQGIIDSPILPSQVKLVYGIDQLIKDAKELGFAIIVCSNQPGIGLKKNTLKNLEDVTEEINSQLQSKGASIDKFYYCMHHPYAKLERFKKKCNCRKPEIGLFLRAARDFNIDLSKSWMIGDGIDDIKAGKTAGCKTILLANISATENLRIIEEQLESIRPDFIVKNLHRASELIRNINK